MVKVLIVDDESHCRDELKHLLSAFDQLEIVGEARNGLEALELWRIIRPEIIFLDIQMPGLTGLEVAAEMGAEIPEVIFVTAYDQHALKAFEVGAIDYLLKPIDEARLSQSVKRLLKKFVEPEQIKNGQIKSDQIKNDEIKNDQNSFATQFEVMMQAWQQAKNDYLARIVARKMQRLIIVPIDEVYCFEIENQLVYAITEKERYWTNYQLKTLEPRLDSQQFVRVHRESIVNIRYVKEIAPITRERYEITLSNGHKLNVSRNYLAQLKQLLGWE